MRSFRNKINKFQPINLIVGHEIFHEVLRHLIDFGGVCFFENFIFLSCLFVNRRNNFTVKIIVAGNKLPKILSGVFVMFLFWCVILFFVKHIACFFKI